MSSIHDKLERVRKPRVHIMYEVETEGAKVQRELPFVVGVLGDFSGNASTEIKPYNERKFVQIDRDNFNDVMARMQPKLTIKVDNKLLNDGSSITVDLKFNSIDDFAPTSIVNQVEPLKELLNARNQLRDLLAKADRSENLELHLEKLLQDKTDFDKLVGEIEAPADKA